MFNFQFCIRVSALLISLPACNKFALLANNTGNQLDVFKLENLHNHFNLFSFWLFVNK
jgi:hypothetical protein